MEPYAHTALPIDSHLQSPRSILVAEAAARHGYSADEFYFNDSEAVTRIVEQALIDAAYSIDAPLRMPGGACYGVEFGPSVKGYAAAFQIDVER